MESIIKNFDNLIRGYQTIRTLNKNEKKNFNVILRGASLRFLLTRIYDSIHKKESKFIKKKDPKEFLTYLIFIFYYKRIITISINYDYTIYTDGACLNRKCWAAIIFDAQKIKFYYLE